MHDTNPSVWRIIEVKNNTTLHVEAIENKKKAVLDEYRVWLGKQFDPFDFNPSSLIFLRKMMRRIQ